MLPKRCPNYCWSMEQSTNYCIINMVLLWRNSAFKSGFGEKIQIPVRGHWWGLSLTTKHNLLEFVVDAMSCDISPLSQKPCCFIAAVDSVYFEPSAERWNNLVSPVPITPPLCTLLTDPELDIREKLMIPLPMVNVIVKHGLTRETSDNLKENFLKKCCPWS